MVGKMSLREREEVQNGAMGRLEGGEVQEAMDCLGGLVCEGGDAEGRNGGIGEEEVQETMEWLGGLLRCVRRQRGCDY